MASGVCENCNVVIVVLTEEEIDELEYVGECLWCGNATNDRSRSIETSCCYYCRHWCDG